MTTLSPCVSCEFSRAIRGPTFLLLRLNPTPIGTARNQEFMLSNMLVFTADDFFTADETLVFSCEILLNGEKPAECRTVLKNVDFFC